MLTCVVLVFPFILMLLFAVHKIIYEQTESVHLVCTIYFVKEIVIPLRSILCNQSQQIDHVSSFVSITSSFSLYLAGTCNMTSYIQTFVNQSKHKNTIVFLKFKNLKSCLCPSKQLCNIVWDLVFVDFVCISPTPYTIYLV